MACLVSDAQNISFEIKMSHLHRRESETVDRRRLPYIPLFSFPVYLTPAT